MSVSLDINVPYEKYIFVNRPQIISRLLEHVGDEDVHARIIIVLKFY